MSNEDNSVHAAAIAAGIRCDRAVRHNPDAFLRAYPEVIGMGLVGQAAYEFGRRDHLCIIPITAADEQLALDTVMEIMASDANARLDDPWSKP